MALKDACPATPDKSKSKPKAQVTPGKTPARTPTKRAASEKVEWTALEEDTSNVLVPVGVDYEGAPQAAIRTKGGQYGKLLRLQAANSFTVTKTMMLTEGEYAGHQAVIIRPARPLEFMEMSVEARNLVYRYYFASNNVVNSAIHIDGKRPGNKEPFAKTFAANSKERVALLAVSKQVHKEAVQVFNALPIRLESTSSVLDFMTGGAPNLRDRVTNMEIRTFQKTSARNALNLLGECKNLTRLHFDSGVANETDATKGAKAFWNEAYKFLHAVAERRADRDKSKAIEVLSFRRAAFTLKDDGKKADKTAVKTWPDSMVQEFKQALAAKLT